MADMEMKEIESAVEAILFASGEPVHVDRICVALEIDRPTAERVLQKLMDYYAFERRGIRLLKIEDSWQLCSSPDYADIIRRAFEIRKPAKLSQPALEVLTIIAYYQPATRAYVDQIRGVDSSYTMGLLLDRGLIEECGRLQVPGRPRQYRTTKQFLRAFHLTSLDELPEMPDLGGEGQMRLDEAGEVVDPTEGVAVTGADAAGDCRTCGTGRLSIRKGGGGRDCVVDPGNFGGAAPAAVSDAGRGAGEVRRGTDGHRPAWISSGSRCFRRIKSRRSMKKQPKEIAGTEPSTQVGKPARRKPSRSLSLQRHPGRPVKALWPPLKKALYRTRRGVRIDPLDCIPGSGRSGGTGRCRPIVRRASWGGLDRDAGNGKAAGDPPAPHPSGCGFCGGKNKCAGDRRAFRPDRHPAADRHDRGRSRAAVAPDLYEEEQTSTSRKG